MFKIIMCAPDARSIRCAPDEHWINWVARISWLIKIANTRILARRPDPSYQPKLVHFPFPSSFFIPQKSKQQVKQLVRTQALHTRQSPLLRSLPLQSPTRSFSLHLADRCEIAAANPTSHHCNRWRVVEDLCNG